MNPLGREAEHYSYQSNISITTERHHAIKISKNLGEMFDSTDQFKKV